MIPILFGHIVEFLILLILAFALFLSWVHAYDVFYNGAESTFFGGDSPAYLTGKFGDQTISGIVNSIAETGSIGSAFSLFGITIIGSGLRTIFGEWALVGSIILNKIILYICFRLLEKSYNIFLKNRKRDLLILIYIFPVVLVYIVGPNKEIFSLLTSCILIRLATIATIFELKS